MSLRNEILVSCISSRLDCSKGYQHPFSNITFLMSTFLTLFRNCGRQGECSSLLWDDTHNILWNPEFSIKSHLMHLLPLPKEYRVGEIKYLVLGIDKQPTVYSDFLLGFTMYSSETLWICNYLRKRDSEVIE
jgi:hypothetical protein